MEVIYYLPFVLIGVLSFVISRRYKQKLNFYFKFINLSILIGFIYSVGLGFSNLSYYMGDKINEPTSLMFSEWFSFLL